VSLAGDRAGVQNLLRIFACVEGVKVEDLALKYDQEEIKLLKDHLSDRLIDM
jgi:hypothetical protein